MNIKTTLALNGALLLAFNVQAGPQAAPKPMDHGKNAMKHDGKEHQAMDHSGPAPSAASNTFQALDSNRDGKLSKAEMAKHPMAAHFAMLDADKNGYLNPKEAAAHGL